MSVGWILWAEISSVSGDLASRWLFKFRLVISLKGSKVPEGPAPPWWQKTGSAGPATMNMISASGGTMCQFLRQCFLVLRHFQTVLKDWHIAVIEYNMGSLAQCTCIIISPFEGECDIGGNSSGWGRGGRYAIPCRHKRGVLLSTGTKSQ